MTRSNLFKFALAGAIAISAMSVTSVANANCLNSKWSKVSGNSYAQTIYGRQCGANKSVKFAGVVNTGWIAMFGGANQFSATFVDNNITTNITMQTNGNTMHVNFVHVDNNGATSLTQGNYQLIGLQ